jgi:catechol 2,3-dioxygenase-like lactoylglutathione lyase family enzyme
VPEINCILETALYVDDLQEAARFYEDIMGLEIMATGDRLVALNAGGGTVLLLFQRGAAAKGVSFSEGRVPPHDGHGPTHFAFAVAAEELDAWSDHLVRNGIEIESRVSWNDGGTSLYFRDPAGHSVELATPGVWDLTRG